MILRNIGEERKNKTGKYLTKTHRPGSLQRGRQRLVHVRQARSLRDNDVTPCRLLCATFDSLFWQSADPHLSDIARKDGHRQVHFLPTITCDELFLFFIRVIKFNQVYECWQCGLLKKGFSCKPASGHLGRIRCSTATSPCMICAERSPPLLRIAHCKRNFNNSNSVKMRKRFTKSSRIVQCGAVQKRLYFVGIVKSFQTYIFSTNWRRYSLEPASQSLPKSRQKLENMLEKT